MPTCSECSSAASSRSASLVHVLSFIDIGRTGAAHDFFADVAPKPGPFLPSIADPCTAYMPD